MCWSACYKVTLTTGHETYNQPNLLGLRALDQYVSDLRGGVLSSFQMSWVLVQCMWEIVGKLCGHNCARTQKNSNTLKLNSTKPTIGPLHKGPQNPTGCFNRRALNQSTLSEVSEHCHQDSFWGTKELTCYKSNWLQQSKSATKTPL